MSTNSHAVHIVIDFVITLKLFFLQLLHAVFEGLRIFVSQVVCYFAQYFKVGKDNKFKKIKIKNGGKFLRVRE